MVKTVRAVAVLEAVSYLVLLAGVVWHRGFDGPDLAPALGPVHGVIFLAYAGLVLLVREQLRWSWLHSSWVVLAAVLPLGGFVVADRLEDRPVAAAGR